MRVDHLDVDLVERGRRARLETRQRGALQADLRDLAAGGDAVVLALDREAPEGRVGAVRLGDVGGGGEVAAEVDDRGGSRGRQDEEGSRGDRGMAKGLCDHSVL